MDPQNLSRIESRVVQAAEAALARQQYATAIDVLVGIGWLTPQLVDQWRQGRVQYLEEVVEANLHKVSTAMAAFRRWARGRGLQPSESAYLARTRDRRPLRFSKSGDRRIELAYRTHWVSPDLSERKRERLAQKQAKPDLVVVLPLKDWTCTECAGTGDLLFMEQRGPLCLRCADLDHLIFLPPGEAALTRRAKQGSALAAVVVRFSRARKRYERQGLLVEAAALEQAEQECLADEDARGRRRAREQSRRADQDAAFQAELAREILRLFPGCPEDRAESIARHSGARGSGRVGRSAAGRALDEAAVTMALAASVRHHDTDYDALLMSGTSRTEARDMVREDVQVVLGSWRSSAAPNRGPVT